MSDGPLHNFSTFKGNCLPIAVTYLANDVAVDLTGYSATLVLRQGVTVLLTLTSPTRITLGGTLGTLDAELTAAETLTLPLGEFTDYELRITDPAGCKTTILYVMIDVHESAIEG